MLASLAAAMALVGWIGWRSEPYAAAAAMALLVVVWLRVDRRYEGAVLFVVAPGRGLVVADLVGLAAAVWAVTLVVRRYRASRGT